MNNEHPAGEARKVLKAKYGKAVSVRRDTGTAYGWVKVKLDAPKPEGCTCEPYSTYCEVCREKMGEIRQEINEAVRGVEFYTYSDDMGGERREFMVDINFI